MISLNKNQRQRKPLSKKQLFLFLMNASSKLVDVIISALKSNDFTLYKLYGPNSHRTNPSKTNIFPNNEKQVYEIIKLLNKYNNQLKTNITQYKLKNEENTDFSSAYKTFKQLTNTMFFENKNDPQQLFKEIITKYSDMKYPLTNQFISKNLFSNSPLLLLSLSEMKNYFTVETFINGMNSLGKAKTISFLKRLSRDIEILLDEITGKHKELNCSQSIPELKAKSTQHKTTPTFPTLKYIQVQIEEMNKTKADITKVENLLKQNNFDYLDYDNSFLSKSTTNFKANTLLYSKQQSMLNKPIKGIRRKILGSTGIKGDSYKNMIVIKSPSDKESKLVAQRNSMLCGGNSFSFSKFNNKRSSMGMKLKKESCSENRKKDVSVKGSSRNNLLETTYEKLRNAVYVKESDVDGKKTVEKLLSDWFGGKVYSRKINVNNTSRDLINMLSIVKNKVEVTNIKKLMNKIYNNKIPVILNHKLEYTEELDHKLKTLDLNVVKTIIKEKLKSKD